MELTLHEDDVQHLEKYCSFLGLNRKPDRPKKKEKCLRVRFGCERIHVRLQSLGLTHRKSYNAVPHPELKMSRDFWRGVVDGDGGVYNRVDTPNLKLYGTLETIFDFIIFCSFTAGIKDKYPSEHKNEHSTFGSTQMLYQVSYYGQDAIKVAKVLYEGSSTYLTRKYNKFLEIKQREKILK